MALPPETCPECGAERPRRAAGCRRCGHIFQDVPAAEAGLTPNPGARALPVEPHPDDGRAERGAGCNSCLLLAAICAGSTVLAVVATWLLVRDDANALVQNVQREVARADLVQLDQALRAWADEHGGGLLPSHLESLELPAGDLHDPWGQAYQYEPMPDGSSARLLCLGADQVPGGEGPGADIERRVTPR